MSKVDTILEEIKGLTLLEASDLVKKMEETFGVAAAAATVVAAGGGGQAGGPRQRNSRTQVQTGTGYRATGPFWAPRSRVSSDPGQVVSRRGAVSFVRFSVLCPKGMR